MTADRSAALEQWQRSHKEMVITLNSLEQAPYVNQLILNSAKRLLEMLDYLMRSMLQ